MPFVMKMCKTDISQYFVVLVCKKYDEKEDARIKSITFNV